MGKWSLPQHSYKFLKSWRLLCLTFLGSPLADEAESVRDRVPNARSMLNGHECVRDYYYYVFNFEKEA